MKNYSRIIAINGGAKTKAAMQLGSKIPVEGVRSRNLVIEVLKNDISFYNFGQEYNFDDALAFNRYPTDTHFCGILLEYLNFKGHPLLNKSSLSYKRSTEKTAQMVRMAMHGLPVPHSLIVHKYMYQEQLPLIESKLNYPFVAKVDGIKGEKVAKIHNQDELHTFLESVKQIEIFICQEMIPNDGDIRILCTLGESLGAIKRTALPGEFLNNYAQGGSVEKYEPTPEEIELAVKASKVNRFDIAGVDIMHTPTGPVLLEVNMGPGVSGFESVFGVNYVFSTIGKKLS